MTGTPGRTVPIAAVEHWEYCPRQAALIHLDQEWADNRATAVGTATHEVVDSGRTRHQPGRRLHHRVPVGSVAHGFFGVCDSIEEDLATGDLAPVEHKSGRVARTPALVQLTLQAIAIEEMTSRPIATGYLFLHSTRRRQMVDVADGELRAVSLAALEQTRLALGDTELPSPCNDDRCPPCSLRGICLPHLS